MIQEGPIEHFFGFKYRLGVVEKAEFPKETDMMKKIDWRGVLRDGYVIKVQSEGQIYIEGNNLHTADNLPVPESGAQAAHIIFNDKFGHNGLCHSRMLRSGKPRAQLLPSVRDYFIPTPLHNFELFIPKAFIKEVFIHQTSKSMVEGVWIITYG